MRERAGLILRLASFALIALVLFQLVNAAMRVRRSNVTIPELPTLPGDEAAAKGTNATTVSTGSAGKGTNAVPVASGTNSAHPIGVTGTNVASTNIATAKAPAKETNSVASAETVKVETNSTPAPRPAPELPVVVMTAAPTKTDGASNALPVLSGTNSQMAMAGTNAAKRAASKEKGTNAPPSRDLAMAGSNPRSAPAKKGPDVPPETKARIDKIVDSEILGPVQRPMPLALIGIAGNSAILRTPGGQTGLVKEGDELGGVKLLKIGVNRVLVEEQGQKKELMIFSGFGGESLLSKPKEPSDETTK